MRDLKNYKVAAPGPVTLKGRYLTLEPYDRAKHLSGLWEALGGGWGINELLKYFPNEDYAFPDDLDNWLQSILNTGNYVTLIAIDNATGKVAGMASYMRPDAKNGVIEVGSVAHGTAMKRSPLSTELHYLMAKHVFEGLHYRRYEWKCHNENDASKASALRYGFTFEGIFRQHVISRGANRDTAWFSMIDGEWPVLKSAFEAWLEPGNFDAEGGQKRRLEDIRAEIVDSLAARETLQ